MNIGFVATEVGRQEGGAYMGGNVNNVVTLSRALADRGHEVSIITTTPRDAAPDPTAGLEWADIFEHTPRFAHGTPGYFVSFCSYAISTAIRLRRQGDLDVLTTHSGFSLWGLVSRVVGTLTSCPTVHVQYCPLDQPSGSHLYDTLQRPWFSRRYLGGIDELVGISPTVTTSLERTTGRRSRTVLPAIDTDEYAPIPEGEKPEVFTITYLGSLKPQKGLDLLVDAFDHLRERQDCRLRLGLEVRSERSNSKLAQRIYSNPDIEVNGIVEDVHSFLARSHVFAVPFRTTMGPADYPVAALEAMACGVPIVATDVGGLRQLVEESDGGICVDRLDPEEIADRIWDVLSTDRHRTDAGRNGRSYIESHCSIEAVSDEYERIASSLQR